MMLRWRPELGALFAFVMMLSGISAIGRSACAQDMPETLLTPDAAAADGGSTPAEEPESLREEPPPEPAPPDAVRLEAQLLVALAFPFGGDERGSAFGFAITYGVGWGSIPIMIGLDFMSVGRSNTSTSRAAVDDATPIQRTSSDRLLDFDLWLRVQPPRWRVRPYAEGFVGAKLVQSRYTIATRDEVTTRGSDNEWTSALGWGIGVDFMGLFNAVGAFSLTLGMRRLHGAKVEIERPTFSNGRGRGSKREVATNETIFLVGLCGRYDFGSTEQQ
jgi:hypothetical protein